VFPLISVISHESITSPGRKVREKGMGEERDRRDEDRRRWIEQQQANSRMITTEVIGFVTVGVLLLASVLGVIVTVGTGDSRVLEKCGAIEVELREQVGAMQQRLKKLEDRLAIDRSIDLEGKHAGRLASLQETLHSARLMLSSMQEEYDKRSRAPDEVEP
jgi:hypothetical protein